MAESSDRLAVAVDGGTTNTRARLFLGARPASFAARAVGVRDVAIGGRREPLERAVAECVAEVLAGSEAAGSLELIVASGMLTSSLGLSEVPHVLAPVG